MAGMGLVPLLAAKDSISYFKYKSELGSHYFGKDPKIEQLIILK